MPAILTHSSSKASSGQTLSTSYDDATPLRFACEFPLGYAGGDNNLYRYAGNSPLSATDPTGQAASSDTEVKSTQFALRDPTGKGVISGTIEMAFEPGETPAEHVPGWIRITATNLKDPKYPNNPGHHYHWVQFYSTWVEAIGADDTERQPQVKFEACNQSAPNGRTEKTMDWFLDNHGNPKMPYFDRCFDRCEAGPNSVTMRDSPDIYTAQQRNKFWKACQDLPPLDNGWTLDRMRVDQYFNAYLVRDDGTVVFTAKWFLSLEVKPLTKKIFGFVRRPHFEIVPPAARDAGQPMSKEQSDQIKAFPK